MTICKEALLGDDNQEVRSIDRAGSIVSYHYTTVHHRGALLRLDNEGSSDMACDSGVRVSGNVIIRTLEYISWPVFVV